MKILINLEDIIVAIKAADPNLIEMPIEKIFIIEEVLKSKNYDINLTLYDFDNLLLKYDGAILLNEHNIIFNLNCNNFIDRLYVKDPIFFENITNIVKNINDFKFKTISQVKNNDIIYVNDYGKYNVNEFKITEVKNCKDIYKINNHIYKLPFKDIWKIIYYNGEKYGSVESFIDSDIICSTHNIVAFDMRKIDSHIKFKKLSEIIISRQKISIINQGIINLQEEKKEYDSYIKKRIF